MIVGARTGGVSGVDERRIEADIWRVGAIIAHAATATQVEVMRLPDRRGFQQRSLGLGLVDARRQNWRNGTHQLILNSEHVFQPTVIALRPAVGAGHRSDKLGTDAHALATAPDAAFQHVSNAEFVPYLPNIDMPALNVPSMLPGSRVRRFADVLYNLPRWLGYELTHFKPGSLAARAAGHLERSWEILTGRVAQSELNPKIYFGSWQVPPAQLDLARAMYRALRKYAPRPYSGKVVLLRARVPSLFPTRGDANGSG